MSLPIKIHMIKELHYLLELGMSLFRSLPIFLHLLFMLS